VKLATQMKLPGVRCSHSFQQAKPLHSVSN
jgi:hypothetical protein